MSNTSKTAKVIECDIVCHVSVSVLVADCYQQLWPLCMRVWVTTCLENLEMSGNYTDVKEMSAISLKVMEMSGNCQEKILSCKIAQKLS